MFDVGFSEVLLLAVLGLLILGPERLPAVARTLGGWVRRARRMAQEFQRELEKEVDVRALHDLKKEFVEVAKPFKEAANTLNDGHSILNRKLAQQGATVSAAGKLLAGHEPESSDASPDQSQRDQIAPPASGSGQTPDVSVDQSPDQMVETDPESHR